MADELARQLADKISKILHKALKGESKSLEIGNRVRYEGVVYLVVEKYVDSYAGTEYDLLPEYAIDNPQPEDYVLVPYIEIDKMEILPSGTVDQETMRTLYDDK